MRGDPKGGVTQNEMIFHNLVDGLSNVILVEQKNIYVQTIYLLQSAQQQFMRQFYSNQDT